jgi:hypothetical protein
MSVLAKRHATRQIRFVPCVADPGASMRATSGHLVLSVLATASVIATERVQHVEVGPVFRSGLVTRMKGNLLIH